MEIKMATLAINKSFNTLIKAILLISFKYNIQLADNKHINKSIERLLRNFWKLNLNKYPPQCKKVHMIYRRNDNA